MARDARRRSRKLHPAGREFGDADLLDHLARGRALSDRHSVSDTNGRAVLHRPQAFARTRELVVEHRNVVHMVYSSERQGLAKVGPKQLLESALRMRPDRILLQELRDGTAFFYLRNVNSGHPGSITTVHAGSAMGAFEQLTLLVKESEGGRDLARDDIRGLLHMLVDIVVQTSKRAGKFEVEEVYFDPPVGRAAAH